jgi:class 3 adenylate cyclase/ketosteroid isomerase-like protein
MKADPETEAAIQAFRQQLRDCKARKDLEGLMELFDEDTVSFGTGADETTVGLDELRVQYERDLQQAGDPPGDEDIWTVISARGEVAWLAAEKESSWIADGRRHSERLRITSVYERRRGNWVCVHAHTSVPDRDQPAGQSYPTPIEAIASSVREERPDLRGQAAPDGTVTMLFTDIENSTNITERLGDSQWLEVLRSHNAIVREQLNAHGCFEVKSHGDGFMVASQSARRALHCAIGIQQGLTQYNQVAPEPVQVRMGLHTGEVLKEADDFFGKHVILASRIAGKARGGEILVSSLLKELTESGGDLRFGEGREVELKGLAGSYKVHALEWN